MPDKPNPDDPHGDSLYRFSFDDLPVRGQWVRLCTCLEAATSVREYPAPIRDLLARMLAAVAMFADNIKFEGAVALQSKGNGALIRTLAECREREFLRGIAHVDDEVPPPDDVADLTAWLTGADGQIGRLALTLIPEPGSDATTYQALVELASGSLADNLKAYFAASEQLPTELYFAATERAVTGLLLQRLPSSASAAEIALDVDDDAWQTITTLASTVTEAELAQLAPQQILRRLFHEYPCRLHPPRSLSHRCSCSREKSDRTLRVLDDEELQSLLEEEGEIVVDCEFCAERYRYDAIDIEALRHPSPPSASGPGGPIH